MRKQSLRNTVAAGLLAFMPLLAAEEFSNTPKPETLAEAIRFEKYKETSAAAQARKDAMEARRGQASRESTVAPPKKTAKTSVIRKPMRPIPSNNVK